MAKEFDIESFAAEERMMLDNFAMDAANNSTTDPVLINSTGPVTMAMEIEMQKETVSEYVEKFIGNCKHAMDIISYNISYCRNIKCKRN